MTINEDILNSTIRHMVWLERYKTSEVKKMLAILAKADSDLVEQIAARLVKIEQRGYDLGPETTKRLESLLKLIREDRAEAFKALNSATQADLFDFAGYEAGFQSRVITNAAAGAGVSLEMAAPAVSQLHAAVTKQPFQGRLLREWYSGLGQAAAQRLSDAVRIGIVEGQTTDQIVRRIRGTRARQYADGLMEISRRDAANIVGTAISHVSNRAKDELYAANDDILKGEKWVSTIDSRTCVRCSALDGQIFKVGQAPPRPVHFGPCRCTVVPYLGPTSIKGTRASAIGPVPDDMNYGDWLKNQPVAVQNEVLGVKKAQLFREGGLEMSAFVDKTGKEYTLDELKRRDAAIWEKVFDE